MTTDNLERIARKCLAACGPGLADPNKHPNVKARLLKRLPDWLQRFDLHRDIIPALSTQTAEVRVKPVYDPSIFETDILIFNKRRLAPRAGANGIVGGLQLLEAGGCFERDVTLGG